MKPTIQLLACLKTRLPLLVMVAVASLAATAHAAAPGIVGAKGAPLFNLDAQDSYLNQPDGSAVYSWGYGCSQAPIDFAPGTYTSSHDLENAACTPMQVPGPTLIVTEGDIVTIKLTNNLPTPAGNTSILFPGFQVCVGSVSSSGTCTPISGNGVPGLLTQEAANSGTVTYSFIASQPGTHSYYSGTQGDLQVEMGLYGALIVLPKTPGGSAGCDPIHATNRNASVHWNEDDYRLSTAAYDIPQSCYDREYLFQFAEMDPNIHNSALAQVTALTSPTGVCRTKGASYSGCKLDVPTEPYHPAYFLINGRSMPDDMDDNYGDQYPHQPYNGNPHVHPGEQVLLRIIGQGRWQHPFHEHANHVRVLARDGNLILTPSGNALAGAPLFTTTTTPGQTIDGIFYYTGRGLNWDMYGHNPNSTDPLAKLPCVADANGYNTAGADNLAYTRVNYYEWCQDHNKPLEAAPLGDVNGGGPATLPNPLILANGNWYGGSPYLGPDATLRATTTLSTQGGGGSQSSSGCVAGTTGANSTPNCSNLLPSNTQANPSNERGFAFMWHSHNEREITTNNLFPGGMMMMLLVDSREFQIDESK